VLALVSIEVSTQVASKTAATVTHLSRTSPQWSPQLVTAPALVLP